MGACVRSKVILANREGRVCRVDLQCSVEEVDTELSPPTSRPAPHLPVVAAQDQVSEDREAWMAMKERRSHTHTLI